MWETKRLNMRQAPTDRDCSSIIIERPRIEKPIGRIQIQRRKLGTSTFRETYSPRHPSRNSLSSDFPTITLTVTVGADRSKSTLHVCDVFLELQHIDLRKLVSRRQRNHIGLCTHKVPDF